MFIICHTQIYTTSIPAGNFVSLQPLHVCCWWEEPGVPLGEHANTTQKDPQALISAEDFLTVRQVHQLQHKFRALDLLETEFEDILFNNVSYHD